jgi:hypothetical protein
MRNRERINEMLKVKVILGLKNIWERVMNNIKIKATTSIREKMLKETERDKEELRSCWRIITKGIIIEKSHYTWMRVVDRKNSKKKWKQMEKTKLAIGKFIKRELWKNRRPSKKEMGC